MMSKKMISKTKSSFVAVLTIGFLIANPFLSVLAEEEPSPAGDQPVSSPEGATPPLDETGAASEEVVPPREEGLLPEVLLDMEVSTEDLGAKYAVIKPGSIFQPFKHFGRNIQEIFTFDPVKDAELKLKHANQELAEIQQLVEEKGITNVNSGAIIGAVNWFENKLEKIGDAAATLEAQKDTRPAEIEALLNELTDKHFKEHKVLEVLNEEIAENRENMKKADEAFVFLKDKQKEALGDFGKVLTGVDDPAKIPDRLSAVANSQEGSEFKMVKAVEILKRLEEEVPLESKEAIGNAQEKVFEFFQSDIKDLTPIARAEKFEAYTEDLPGDETIQLTIFENLKQLPDVPQDILEKIEAVKEFAVHRLETKVANFDNSEVQDKFFEDLEGEELDDILVLEELKAKITAKQEAIKKKVEQKHQEGLAVFKKKFTDVQSQDQAKRFEKLVGEMTANPNPKILRLIEELEKEVAQDSEKRAFIEDIKSKTKTEFENKFRQEGERFFERIASFNPEDMLTFQEFEGGEFFDPRMMNQFFGYQTNNFKAHIQKIEDPELFNRFDERLRFAPPQVVNMIKTHDSNFGEAMQFKARKMMEMELELKERDMRFSMERAWRETENNFQLQLRQVKNDEEKANLYKQKREQEFALVQKDFEGRKQMMEVRFANDPFCDSVCQEFQRRYLGQDLDQRQWQISEDARMREFELEMKMASDQRGNPFQGRCDNPESCMTYCKQNPDFSACKIHAPISMQVPFRQGETVQAGVTMGPPPCPAGEINMPAGPNHWVCTRDPYWKPSEAVKQCPPGHFWNEKGYCQFDEKMFIPQQPQTPQQPGMPYPVVPLPMPIFCGPGEHWEEMRGCVREDFATKCGPGEYFDFYEKRCKLDKWQSCPPGEYWDTGKGTCIKDIFVPPVTSCPPGQFWDFFKKQCSVEHICPQGEYWDSARNSCIRLQQPTCPSGEYWSPAENRCVSSPTACPTLWDPVCGTDNRTYSNDCQAKQSGVSVQYRGNCGPTPTTGYCGDKVCNAGETTASCPGDCPGYCGDKICQSNETSSTCSMDCGVTTGYCGDKICQSNETSSSCPTDCGGTTTGYCGDKICNNAETYTSCPSDCGTTTGCTSTSCGTGYYCGASGTCMPQSTTGCTNWATTGQGCNPSTGTCCSSGTCSNPSGPGSCVASTTGTSCVDNEWTTNAGACDYSVCPNGCNMNYNGCPDGCMSYAGYCGDNVCSSGETVSSCPGDCGTTTGTQTCSSKGGTCCSVCSGGSYISGTECNCCGTCQSSTGYCGDGMCNNAETMTSCPGDCGGTTTGYCGDNICNMSETIASCPTDCTTPTTGYCGDYICQSNETSSTCSMDCGGASTGYCGDGMCSSTESQASCPSDCGSVGYCGDGTCGNYETSTSCPQDCGGTPVDICGDGICGSTESQASCASDCGGTPPPAGYCGDGMCDSWESSSSCSTDCGGGMPALVHRSGLVFSQFVANIIQAFKGLFAPAR